MGSFPAQVSIMSEEGQADGSLLPLGDVSTYLDHRLKTTRHEADASSYSPPETEKSCAVVNGDAPARVHSTRVPLSIELADGPGPGLIGFNLPRAVYVELDIKALLLAYLGPFSQYCGNARWV